MRDAEFTIVMGMLLLVVIAVSGMAYVISDNELQGRIETAKIYKGECK